MASSAAANSAPRVPPDHIVFGQSEIMGPLRAKIDKVACANVPVLITGESGTGKELIARMIHDRSPWAAGPFVKVNCPAIPGTLLESELFGYEKGAFTGAFGVKPGRVEMAHRGTLFLDEIAELDAESQAKLLQVLQDGCFCRIGGQEDKRVEVRLVCATNRRLLEEIGTGNFREDLFYRINVLNLHLPSLRERRKDLPDLIAYFIAAFNEQYNCKAKPVSAQLMTVLQEYHWPGNIRELENLTKRYVILGSEEAVLSELMSRKPESAVAEIPLDGSVPLKKVTRQLVLQLERQVILRCLQANNWNRKRTARLLHISYRALLYKIRESGLSSSRALKLAANGNSGKAACPPAEIDIAKQPVAIAEKDAA